MYHCTDNERRTAKTRKGDFYWLLEYGEKYVCEKCGVHFLSEAGLPSPILCRRCERRKDNPTQVETIKTSKKTVHKAKLSDEERQRRKRISNKKYKDAHKEQANKYVRERKQTDPVYKLKCQARNTIYHSFARTGNAKQERCERVTGLPINDLIAYLCGTYEQVYGKEWDGVEPVHIDHIIPLSTAKTEDDVMRLCHYTNLQLLTAQDNLAKGSKYAESKVGAVFQAWCAAD